MGYTPPPIPPKRTITAVFCKFCGTKQDVENQPASCPNCGGKGVVVKTLEIEQERMPFAFDSRQKGPI